MTNLDVRHKCDNPKCINLEHLEHGTRKENINDIYQRDRHRFNLRNKEILEIASIQNMTNREIADKYNVNIKRVNNIRRGKFWSNITGIEFIQKDKQMNLNPDEIGLKYIFKETGTDVWRVVIKVKNKNYSVGRHQSINKAIEIRNTYLKMMEDLTEKNYQELKRLCKVVKQMYK